LINISKIMGSNKHRKEAVAVRENNADYFIESGAVP
jgi:hypothetical protein